MHTTSPKAASGHPLRRRTLSAAGVGIFLGGLLFGMAIEAVAGEAEPEPVTQQDVTPNGIAAELRMSAFVRASERASQDDLAFLADEFADLVAFVAPEGISLERREVWSRLADCESGDWRKGQPLDGSRRWDYGLTFDHGDIFEGGLNFHPRTWDSFRDDDMPKHAGQATALQQMVVGERVLADQGWGAWPVCSRKLGYR